MPKRARVASDGEAAAAVVTTPVAAAEAAAAEAAAEVRAAATAAAVDDPCKRGATGDHDRDSDSDADTNGCTCPEDNMYWEHGQDSDEVFERARSKCTATVHRCTCWALFNVTSSHYREAHPCRAPEADHGCTCRWEDPRYCKTRGDCQCICAEDRDTDNTNRCEAYYHDCTCDWPVSSSEDPEDPSMCRKHDRVWGTLDT